MSYLTIIQPDWVAPGLILHERGRVLHMQQYSLCIFHDGQASHIYL